MGNFISTFLDSRKSTAAQKAATVEAAIAQAKAITAQSNATAQVAQAKAAFAKSIYEVPSVDPVVESANRNTGWQNDNISKVMATRSLYETDPLASVVVNKIVENEVGQGPQLESITGDQQLNKVVESLWDGWNDTAEVSGLTWGEFCQLAKVHEMVDGDVACLLLNDEPDDYNGNGKIQLICADQIVSRNKEQGEKGNGIITDTRGYVIGYNIQHAIGEDIIEYPSNAVIFLARRKALRDSLRRRKYRGDSVFNSNYELFQKACKWRNAEVNAAIAAAKIVFVMTKNQPDKFNAQFNTATSGTPTNTTTGDREMDLSGSTAVTLEPGEDIKQFQGTHPTSNFSEPFRLLVRELGAETGLPLEMLLLDFSQGNFSSTKTALIFTQRAFKQRQEQFINRFLMPIYKWRINRWVKEGKFAAFTDISGIYNARFTLPKFPVIDPLKEAQTEQLLRDMSMRTLSDYCNENGLDYEEHLERVASEQKVFASKGIQRYHSNNSMPLDTSAKSAMTGTVEAISTEAIDPQELMDNGEENAEPM